MAETKQKKFKILHDRDECISCSACESVSKNWTLATRDGKADPKMAEISESEFRENMDAAEVCPINIIHILNRQTGERVI